MKVKQLKLKNLQSNKKICIFMQSKRQLKIMAQKETNP